MRVTAQTLPMYAGVGVLLLVGLWLAKRGVGGVAYDAAHAVVTVADGVAGGVVVGAAGLVGVPATDQAQCQIDLQNSDILSGALWSCPLGTLLEF